MKFWRLIVGLAVVLAAAWVLIGEQLAGVSADAVVNARVVTVRAPIAGRLSIADRNPGSRIAQGEVLGSLVDPTVDSVRLNDLLLERDYLAASERRLSGRVSTLVGAMTVAAQRTAAFKEGQIDVLTTHLQDPTHDGAATAEAGDLARFADADPAARVLNDASARLSDPVAVQLDYAKRGVFLGNGYNDAPWSEQFGAELAQMEATAAGELAETRDRMTALDKRIDRERARLAELKSQELTSPVESAFWEYRASNGQWVERGDPLLDILDCGSILVTASVTESVFNGLSTGDPVKFRLAGLSETLDGTVARLAGSGAETIYRGMAVAPHARHLERYDVAIIVPALKSETIGCTVGRTGRLFFSSRPLDFLR